MIKEEREKGLNHISTTRPDPSQTQVKDDQISPTFLTTRLIFIISIAVIIMCVIVISVIIIIVISAIIIIIICS